jgi:Escherichia/Staphylococcus phage prohead protease
MNVDVDSRGRFSGYGAVFGNVDAVGDIIERGSFTDTLAKHKREGTMPFLFLQHNEGNGALEDSWPVGVWQDAFEDSHGLFMRGQLALGSKRADDVYALMRTDPPAINSLSVGFIAKRFTLLPRASLPLKRRIHAMDLIEVSLVHIPCNPKALVTNVKSCTR